MSDLFKVEVSIDGASAGPYFCATVIDVHDDGVVVEFDEITCNLGLSSSGKKGNHGEINRKNSDIQGEISSNSSSIQIEKSINQNGESPEGESPKPKTTHRFPFINVRLPPKPPERGTRRLKVFTVGETVDVYTWEPTDEKLETDSGGPIWGWFRAIVKDKPRNGRFSGHLYIVQYVGTQQPDVEEITTDIVETKCIRKVNSNPSITKETFVRPLLFMPSELHFANSENSITTVQRSLITGKRDVSINTDSDKTVTSNTDLMNVLECPVCFTFMDGQIFQCDSGHPFCGTCKEKLKNECHTCKKPFTEKRALLSEHIAELIHKPCKNKGCETLITISQQKEHEFTCQSRHVKCDDCAWEGSISELAAHIRGSNHNTITHYFLVRARKLTFNDCEKYRNRWVHWNYLISGDDVFQFRMIVNDVGHSWFCCRLFGTRDRAKSFQLVLKLGTDEEDSDNDDENENRYQFKASVDVHCDLDKQDGHCIRLFNYEGLKNSGFIDKEGKVRLRYTLLRK